jgi:hypothetical protein
VRTDDVKAVIHGNRGNNHASKITEKQKQKVKDFAAGKYKGFNDMHMQEKLLEKESIQINSCLTQSIWYKELRLPDA